MGKIIDISDLERRCRAVLDEIVRERVPYVLARDGQPQAALIPYDDYAAFTRFRQSSDLADWRFGEMLDRLAEQNAQYSEDEVAADVEAAREEVAAAAALKRAGQPEYGR